MGQPRQRASEPITVWLVEDRAEFRETVQELLTAAPDILCPHSFETAEELFSHLNDHFAPEVILMDIGLPGMSGIDAVRRLSRVTPATQVVMLTIHDDSDRIFEAICAGATGYLSKAAPGEELLRGVRDVCRGGAAMTPHIARRVLDIFSQVYAPKWDYQLTDREKDPWSPTTASRPSPGISRGGCGSPQHRGWPCSIRRRTRSGPSMRRAALRASAFLPTRRGRLPTAGSSSAGSAGSSRSTRPGSLPLRPARQLPSQASECSQNGGLWACGRTTAARRSSWGPERTSSRSTSWPWTT